MLLFGANFQLYSSGTTGKCSMADWAGFSEAELERIKHASEATTEKCRPKIVKPVLSKRTLQGIPGKLKQPGQVLHFCIILISVLFSSKHYAVTFCLQVNF